MTMAWVIELALVSCDIGWGNSKLPSAQVKQR
jgi:hypothetical protein